MKIENLIRGHFGQLGVWTLDVLDSALHRPGFGFALRPEMRIADMPLARRFIKDDMEGGERAAFYDLRNEVDSVVSTVRSLQRRGLYEEAAKVATREEGTLRMGRVVKHLDAVTKKFREAKSQVVASQLLSRAMKRAMLDDLERRENEALRGVTKLSREADLPIGFP